MTAIDLCNQTGNGVTQVVKCSVVIDIMIGQNIVQSCFGRMFLLLRRKRADGNWYNYEVFWWENCWGIKGGAEVASLILPLCGLQVVGNIYDNPELIKEDTD